MPAKTSKLARVTEALALQHKGATNAAIAEQMGLSLSTVKRLLASDVAREVVAKTAEEARKTLSASADAAAHVLVDIATDEDAKDADRINAAKTILDRAGVVNMVPTENAAPPPPPVDVSTHDAAAKLRAIRGGRGKK